MSEEAAEITVTVEQMIRERDLSGLGGALAKLEDPEVADQLVGLEKAQRLILYRALPRNRAADVFAHLEPADQDALLKALTDQDARQLLADLSPDDRTALLAELPAQVTQRLMELLSPGDLDEARQLLGYPEDSVGRLMTPDYVRLRAEWTVAQALDHIRRYGRDSEIVNILYVIDGAGRLVDIIRMRRLIMAAPDARIADLLNHRFVSVSAFDDREVAVERIRRYDVNALPVVDSEGILLGIVTVDDIFDVAEEEATEDIQKGVAVAPLDMKYSAAAATTLFGKRIGWLVVLIFVNLVSAGVIAHYEEYLMEFIALTFFMPLLIASGGNSGAQSATLMVRAIATGDLGLGDWLRAVGKEVVVGLLLGVVLGVLAYGVGFFHGDWRIAFIVGASMLSLVVVANVFGALMPFALSHFRIDPAVASSPLITSVMDALGLLIYFSIASAVLGTL